jgi:O-antigen ligase
VSQTSVVARMVKVFPVCFGAFLGLTVVKFGNPPIMERYVTTPSNIWEVMFNFPWPIDWAYGLLGLLAVAGLLVARWKVAAPLWLVSLPLIWLSWEFLATNRTIFIELSNPTLKHFAACVVCFYLGLFSLSRAQRLTGFWFGISCGFLLVLAVGWQQHFGGLAQTKQYFYTYIYPQLKEVSPEYLKKISSTRIFSTLFYPNALAGTLLLVLPVVLAFIWSARQRLTLPARAFLLILITVGALGCLLWSGSKGGWLLMLLLGLIAVLRASLPKRIKVLLVLLVLLVGLPAFFARYARFFQRGATSVSARFDYWRAALQTATANPVFGTGPGTFAIPYSRIKRPESEMSRLVHNDYLEQASDSGLPGFFAYTSFIIGVLIVTAKPFFKPHGSAAQAGIPTRQSRPPGQGFQEALAVCASEVSLSLDWQRFALWLGVLGWACQGLFEFGLYIPALGWLAFAFMGLLLGTRS